MKKTFKALMFILPIFVIGFLIASWIFRDNISRTRKVLTLFEEDKILHNFLNMEDIFPVSVVYPPKETFQFKKGACSLPENFDFEGETINVEQYLKDTRTTGFIVMKNDSLLLEQYFQGHNDTTTHISWSVAKSFVSALFGIAIERGQIKSVQDKVTDYLPEFEGTGYDGVIIKDVLQMSTGVLFNEDYGDFYSDINRMGRALAWGSSMDQFSQSLKNEKEPGSYNHYVSINTHILAMILTKVTGKSITQQMQEELWNKIGAEHEAKWILDDKGMEFALGGLNVTLRDYARFGRLFLKKGNWEGEQIIPASWIQESTTMDAPHLLPGDHDKSSNHWGYGYQWWMPDVESGDFFAAGIYNQFIYVCPRYDLIIVKNSSNHNFAKADDQSKLQSIHLFQAIVEHVHQELNNELVTEN